MDIFATMPAATGNEQPKAPALATQAKEVDASAPFFGLLAGMMLAPKIGGLVQMPGNGVDEGHLSNGGLPQKRSTENAQQLNSPLALLGMQDAGTVPGNEKPGVFTTQLVPTTPGGAGADTLPSDNASPGQSDKTGKTDVPDNPFLLQTGPGQGDEALQAFSAAEAILQMHHGDQASSGTQQLNAAAQYATTAQHQAGAPAQSAAVPVTSDTGVVFSAHAAKAVDAADGMISITHDGARLTVSLEPDGLGKMDLNLSLHKGLVTGQIQVADNATRNIIENNMHEIVSALLKEGISVGGFSVSLKNGGFENGDPDGPGRPAKGRDDEVSAATTSPVSEIKTAGLVSIFV